MFLIRQDYPELIDDFIDATTKYDGLEKFPDKLQTVVIRIEKQIEQHGKK